MIWTALLTFMLMLVLVLAGIPLLIGVWLSARFGFYLGCAVLILVSLIPIWAIVSEIYASNCQIVGWENENSPIYDRDCGPSEAFVVLVFIVLAPVVVALSVVLMKLRLQIGKRPLTLRSV